jgi:hypothetical protein
MTMASKRPRGRPSVVTPAIEKEIAEMLWLAFNNEQIALACGISEKTVQRVRVGDLWPQVKMAEIGREKPFRTKIWKGGRGWQGAAWFLERKYPREFARPEIQLNISASTTNTTNILITASELEVNNSRLKAIGSTFDQWLTSHQEKSVDPNTIGNGNGHADMSSQHNTEKD